MDRLCHEYHADIKISEIIHVSDMVTRFLCFAALVLATMAGQVQADIIIAPC